MATRKTTTARNRAAQSVMPASLIGLSGSVEQNNGAGQRTLGPEPIGEVTMAVSEMKGALQHQDTIIGRLEAALAPVLSPASQSADGSEDPPRATPLGGQLNDRLRHINGNTLWIQTIIDRLSI